MQIIVAITKANTIKGIDKGFFVGASMVVYFVGVSFIFLAYFICTSGNNEPPKPQLLQT
jgi:hypothetical protein